MTVTVNGVTSNVLTSGLDTVKVIGTGADIISGVSDNAEADNTLNSGDVIRGNGNTILNAQLGEGPDPTFTLSGVKRINFYAADTKDVTFDATKWHDVHLITLQGEDDFGASVTNFAFTGAIKGRVDNAGDGQLLYINGGNDLIHTISMTMINYDGADGKAAVASYDPMSGDVLMRAGSGDTVTMSFTNKATGGGLVSADGLTIGDVRVVSLGQVNSVGGASIDFSVTADLTAAGTATAGDFTIGNISALDKGDAANIDFDISYSVNGDDGNAIGGNYTIGNIDTVVSADAGTVSITSYYVGRFKTDGTFGDFTIGDITHTAKDGGVYVMYDYYYYTVSGGAGVDEGTLTTGKVLIGDIVCQDLGGASNGTMTFYFTASNANGDTTAGPVDIGNISLLGADYKSNDYLTYVFNITQSVTANYGLATAGAMTIGDIVVSGGAEFSLGTFTIYRYVSGSQTDMGATTIGDITAAVGASGAFEFDITVSATATRTKDLMGDHMGPVTIGDLNLHVGYNATGSYSLYVQGSSSTLESFSVGNWNIVVDDSATLNFTSDNSVGAVGNITYGDINIYGGYLSDVNIDLEWSATDSSTPTYGKLGNVTMGDVHVVADESASIDDLSMNFSASGNIGKVTIGDIFFQALEDGSIQWSATFDSDYGKIGAVNMGNIDIRATGDGASASATLEFTAYTNVAKGGITVGDVNVIARGDAEATLNMEFSGTYGDIGHITCGDVVMKAIGSGAVAHFTITAEMDNDTMTDFGGATFGDMVLVGRGNDIAMEVSITFSSVERGGDVTIGDVKIVLDNDGAVASKNVYLSYTAKMEYDGGDMFIGDLVFRAGDITANYTSKMTVSADLSFDLDSGTHDLHIGNIKVIGGYTVDSGVLDNFSSLSTLLDITKDSDAEIYIGNVDYSKYRYSATIGDTSHDWIGMGVIKAAQDDTTIYDTEGQNIIYLGDGDDTIYFAQTQTADEADFTKIDTIYNFDVDTDVMDLNSSGTTTQLGNHFDSYEAFLAQAGTTIKNSGIDLYVAVIGEDSYVAVDKDDNSSLDWVVKVVGVTDLAANDLNL